jgi:zeta-carotene desaturase
MSSKKVIVIGGGLAGLSAGVALAEAGYQITLLEKRPFLGGRATSYVLPNGEHVDNCQHITLGCCTNLSDFYRRAGAAGKIRFFDRYEFCSSDMRRGNLHSSFLPAPLHLAMSFLKFPLLGWRDKRAIGKLLLSIARAGGQPADLDQGAGAMRPNMLDWLRFHGQTESALTRFWGPVIASALDRNSAGPTRNMVWMFSGRRFLQIGKAIIMEFPLYRSGNCMKAAARRWKNMAGR